MRFPSLDTAVRAAGETFARFPLALLCGIAAAASASWIVESSEEFSAVRWLMTAALGLSLFTALETRAARFPDRRALRASLLGLGVLLLAGFYLGTGRWLDPILARRFAQAALAFHLFAAVLAYWRIDERRGFWQFNRRLFERILVSTIFAGVLYLGLVLALLALDKLFGLDVRDETYAHLGFAIAFVFHPAYFLGGVPHDLAELEGRTDYPAGLKIFSQYILVPLAIVYLLILTAYLGRVAITRIWPSGWIGWLVSGVSVLGILALLLVHPVRERAENRWVATFSRGFWIALLPALAMLFLSIAQRVQQYGVTENRYFLFVFALWLAGLAIFYIVRRSGGIQVIPWSLALIAVGTAFGPWGAYSVSERSQTDRLRAALERHGLLEDVRVQAVEADVPFEDRREIGAGLRYLAEHHGTASVAAWFETPPAEVDSLQTEIAKRRGRRPAATNVARAYMTAMGLEYVEGVRPTADGAIYASAEVPGTAWDVRAWDAVVQVQGAGRAGAPGSEGGVPVAGTSDSLRVTLGPERRTLRVEDGETLRMTVPLTPILERVRRAAQHGGALSVPADSLALDHEEPGGAARFEARWLNVDREGEQDRVQALDGMLLLRLE